MRWLPVLGLLLACLSCGGGARACQAACDCPATTQSNAGCVGEWVCGSAKTCEYQCKTPCPSGSVFTCRSEEECNGTICSERKACR